MQFIFIAIFLGIATKCSATLSGPFLLWGYEKVLNLQPKSLIEASEQDLVNIFRDAKAIVIFLQNNTNRFNADKYPNFEQLVKRNAWTYLPQRYLTVDPFNYNTNIEVISLSGNSNEEDSEILSGFKDANTIYGENEVLGILASQEDESHFLTKRDAKENEDELRTTSTTTESPTPEETEDNFIYVAVGQKAILYLNTAPILNISNSKESIKLVEHNKAISFDDQRTKGYGRLNIIFTEGVEKVILRFNFSLNVGTWSLKSVEVEYKDYKTIIPIVGNPYNIPSAPLGTSYRCSSRPILFTNGNDSLVLNDYQVQPWLEGADSFGEVYDCVGFTTTPIWAGVLVSLFLCGILAIGIIALMDIKTPNRFESSRSKQLTFTVQE